MEEVVYWSTIDVIRIAACSASVLVGNSPKVGTRLDLDNVARRSLQLYLR